MLTRTTQEKADFENNKPQREQAAHSRTPVVERQPGDFDASMIADRANIPGKKRSILATIVRAIIQVTLMVAILFASFMAMNQLIASKPEIRKRPSFRTVYTVQTVPVALSDHRPKFTVYGEAAASRSVDLRSLVSGEVISVNPKLRAGTRVNKGDALVEIDRFNFEGALREATANRNEILARIRESKSRVTLEISKIQRLDEQLELARSDHKRIAELRQNGTATQKQLDDRTMVLSQRAQAVEQSQFNLQTEKAKLEQQKAGLARLDWRLQLAERNLANTILKAPFDGIVRSTGVEIGKTVSANDIVVSLYEDANIDIRFTLTDERYGRLQADHSGLIGRAIEIIWAIGGRQYSYPAIIDRVGAVITSSRGGVEIFATLEQVKDSPAIRPGAFVEIHVPDILFVNTAKVPESALYDGNTIYLRQGGQLVSMQVQVHAHSDGSVLISGDLNSGERILITRIAEISDGLKVQEEGEKTPGARPDERGKKPDPKARKGA